MPPTLQFPPSAAESSAAPAGPIWSDDELQAWSPPLELNPAEWAEQYRELKHGKTSRPGPWRNANQPALVGLMVLAAHKELREIWAKKCGQFGASEGVRNIIGQRAHQNPGPAMLVLPDEKTGRKIVRKTVVPFFEETPVLRALLTGNVRDKKLSGIALSNGFELSLGWAGSAAAMAADPYREVFLDEVDKYRSLSQQAEPIEEARARVLTYEDSLVMALSTPSNESGPIAVGYEACSIKVDYYCPCPHCGKAFRPCFDRLVWEKFPELQDPGRRAAAIIARKAAWLECDLCAGQLKPGEAYPVEKRIFESHRRAMLMAGWWATPDQGWRIYTDGRFEGEKPEGEKVGLHIHCVLSLSPAISLAKIAAKFVECDKKREKLQGFYNLWLGLEFRDQSGKSITANIFRDRCLPNVETGFTPPAARTVPTWASKLVMTVDTQKDYFWFLIRAWGHGLRSQRVHHGRAQSFQELEDLYYKAHFPYEGDAYQPLRCFGGAPIAIDSGGGMDREESEHSITDRVYQWCLKDPTWRYPIKGASKSFEERIRPKKVTYTPPDKTRSQYDVFLHFLDPIYWRDLLHGYIAATIPILDLATGEVTGETWQWGLNDRCDEEYNRHLAEMQKTWPKKGAPAYRPKTSGARHDYHDLESYQIAWAHGPANCSTLPSPKQLEQMRIARASAAERDKPTAAGGVKMPDGRPFLVTNRK